jgi:hypothetical protein
MKTIRANIIILSGVELTIMNGEIKANIHLRRMPESLRAQLFFHQWTSTIEALLMRVTKRMRGESEGGRFEVG